MPDKAITQYTPVANDVRSLTVVFDGAGGVSEVVINVGVRDSDGGVSVKNCSAVDGDFTADLASTAAEGATKAAADLGF